MFWVDIFTVPTKIIFQIKIIVATVTLAFLLSSYTHVDLRLSQEVFRILHR